MRLKKLKLSGFKSFADTTTIAFPSDIVGIVGPNGCGKSNIIDAIRWVMGESSAKHLRGQALSDVIFNGTNSRHPVGQALVELIFDNETGKIAGPYASYSEIVVKRTVTRDNVSNYYLNGTKCRRRDVLDIIMGTGVGPRSYAIIEQGMISKLIDAKPEEMRHHLEEVAGISKYKDRRRDTETRIRHTRENLERLNDIKQEIEKQLSKLERQAKAAKKFNAYKDSLQEKELALQLLNWYADEAVLTSFLEKIRACEIDIEAKKAEYQSIELSLEKKRLQYQEKNDSLQHQQAKFYQKKNEVTQIQQTIEHHEEKIRSADKTINDSQQQLIQLEAQQTEDDALFLSLTESKESLLPEKDVALQQLEESKQCLRQVKECYSNFEERLDDNQLMLIDAKTKVEQLQNNLTYSEKLYTQHLKDRETLTHELNDVSLESRKAEAIEFEKNLKTIQDQLKENKSNVEQEQAIYNEQTIKEKQLQSVIQEHQAQVQSINGQLILLEKQQERSLQVTSHNNESIIKQFNLTQKVVDNIEIDDKWSVAFETLLGSLLKGRTIDKLDSILNQESFDHAQAISLLMPIEDEIYHNIQDIKYPKLMDYVKTNLTLPFYVYSIYCADNLKEAAVLLKQMPQQSSVVTPEGYWLGHGWVQAPEKKTDFGLIKRNKEIKQLKDKLTALNNIIQEKEIMLNAVVEQKNTISDDLNNNKKRLNELQTSEYKVLSQLNVCQSKVQSMQTQIKKYQEKIKDISESIEAQKKEQAQLRGELEVAINELDSVNQKNIELKKDKLGQEESLEEARDKVETYKQAELVLEEQLKSLELQLQNAQQLKSRTLKTIEKLNSESNVARLEKTNLIKPIEAYKLTLQQLLDAQQQEESIVHQMTDHIEALAHSIKENEKKLAQEQLKINDLQAENQQKLLDKKEIEVKKANRNQWFLEHNIHSIQEQYNSVPKEYTVTSLKTEIENLNRSISKLGQINMAAIDEYTEEEKRKEYINQQFDDLTQALSILEQAIDKIDKETKSVFKNTFDVVNNNLMTLFPKVFTGGKAYLELTDNDLLTSGVQVVAKPPGKKNVVLSMLSGGEKALTAIALVFSIFKLNPAPFCLLDEVDAPLDDTNVGRYAKLVKEMSSSVQFMFISHNKITMEIAEHLMGITMHEAGVSKVVSVDINEAEEMVA